MSFVSVCATENFLTLMSDGRAVNWEGENFIIVPGQHKKFIQPTPQTFVAYGGRVGLIDRFVAETGLSRLAPCDFGAMAEALQEKLQGPPYAHGNVMLFFGGINSVGKIVFCACGTGKEAVRVYQPRDGDLMYGFAYDDSTMKKYLDDGEMRDIFVNIFRATGIGSPSMMLSAQKFLNDYVAQNNPTVDNDTTEAIIMRQGAC